MGRWCREQYDIYGPRRLPRNDAYLLGTSCSANFRRGNLRRNPHALLWLRRSREHPAQNRVCGSV
jgi:hypothetical protein